MAPTILIVDDERNIRRTFGMVLRAEGFAVREAESGEEALGVAAREACDLVILDVRLPGIDGLETLRRLRAAAPERPVVMISGHGTIATAVEATREGAVDFLEKPCSRERLLLAARNALRLAALDRELASVRAREDDRFQMLGESPAIAAVREQIARVAPTGARVLIRGESGAGKELVARAIHAGSDRRDKPFVKVNCAAIPEELIESELFGAVRGAYTGATESRDGKFLQADGGTLFLDEVGDMSLRAQAKVLRALQEGEIEKVGGSGAVKVDVRVLAASNKDLAAEARAGRFRDDLLFRLDVVPIVVPPLRERRADIPLLAERFLARYCLDNNLPPRRLHADAVALLQDLPWPGNVRELQNAIERLAIMSAGPEIAVADLARTGVLGPGAAATGGAGAAGAEPWGPAFDAAATASDAATPVPLSPARLRALGGLVEARRQFEAACIRECLRAAHGNVSQAARLLGIDRTNLHKKIQALGLGGESREGPDNREET